MNSGGTATVVGHVSPAAGRSLTITATPYGGTPTVVAQGPVDASGNLTKKVKVSRNTVFKVSFAGDAAAGPAEDSVSVGARARVTVTQNATTTVDGYGLYSAGLQPLVKGAVTPVDAPGCLEFVVQQYVVDRWRAVSTVPCVALSTTGRAQRRTNTFPSGAEVRVGVRYTGCAGVHRLRAGLDLPALHGLRSVSRSPYP